MLKKLLKLIIGIALLAIGLMLASDAGTRIAGGTGKGITIPIGTVKVEYSIKGE